MSADVHYPYATVLSPLTKGTDYRQTRLQPKFGASATSSFKAATTNFTLAMSSRTLSQTEKIVETFLWSFLALDAFGMWAPRIPTGGLRQADHYDVRQDPEMRDKPLHQQVKKSIVENVKGLNWVNIYEETGREFATGPGMLIIPTLVYFLMRRTVGGQTIRLASQALTEHGTAFAKHLASTPESHALNQALTSPQARSAFLPSYRDEVRRYLVHVFKDDALFKFNVLPHLKQYRQQLSAQERRQLDALLPLSKVKTGEQYLDQWFKLWTERHVHPGQVPSALTRKGKDEMAPAYAELNDILIDKFNEHHQFAKKLQQLHSGGNGKIDLMTANQVTMLGHKGSLSGFLGNSASQGDLEKLGHYFSYIAGERFAGKPGHIADVATGVMQRAGARKTIQLLAALISGAYVALLVKFTQKHDAYPGERLAHLETTGKHNPHKEKHDIQMHQDVKRLINSPPLYGSSSSQSPFSLQLQEGRV